MATSNTSDDSDKYVNYKKLELDMRALEEYLKRDFRLTTVVQKSNVPLPKAILLTGDVAENARFFRASWANCLVASGNAGATEEEKKALLLSSIGEEYFRRYENMPLTVEERATSDALIAAIEKHLVPEKNKVRVADLSEKQLKEIASNGEEKVQQVQHKNFPARN